jgi:hypothetical protein
MFGAGNEPDQATCDRLFGTMDALPQGLTIAKPNTFTSTGFNQFNPDNVLEGKAIVDNAIVSGDKKIAVIPCLPCKVGVGENNGYCIHGEFGDDIKVYLTPLNPMEVEGELYMHELTKDATTDTYVPQIKGYMLVEVPTTANLCAHFLWSEDKCERDSYEPYFESKIELPVIPQMSEWGLAGIQSSGTLACDEIDFERGVYVQRVAIKTFDETNTYQVSGTQFDGTYTVYSPVTDVWIYYKDAFMSEQFACHPGNTYTDSSFNKEGIYCNNSLTICDLVMFRISNDRGVTDLNSFKAWIAENPITVLCPLKNPIETALTADELTAFEALRTNHTNTTVMNDKGAYMVMEYNGDIKTYLDKLPKATGAEVQAAVDAWLTAHFANAEGVSF